MRSRMEQQFILMIQRSKIYCLKSLMNCSKSMIKTQQSFASNKKLLKSLRLHGCIEAVPLASLNLSSNPLVQSQMNSLRKQYIKSSLQKKRIKINDIFLFIILQYRSFFCKTKIAFIYLLFLMLIAELGKIHPQKEQKVIIEKKILPFRFKTFQCEVNGHWTSIGKALTNRYHKFNEGENKNTIERNFITPRLSQLPKYCQNLQFEVEKKQYTPRFEIKRKYLSFNPEKQQKRTITSLKSQYITMDSEQKNSLNSSILFQKNKQILDKQSLRDRDFLGTYFIPKNKNPYQKMKYLLFKKGKKRNVTNPELHINTKYKEKKQSVNEAKNMKLRKLYEGAELKGQKCKSLQKEQKQYFRPWSSKQDQL